MIDKILSPKAYIERTLLMFCNMQTYLKTIINGVTDGKQVRCLEMH